ncbi:MAG: CBS domain-containing protein [Candidatus Micrarchaeia archaeon]
MDENLRVPEKLVSNSTTFDYNTPITEVIPALNRNEAVIIQRDGKYYGIVDSRAIYRKKEGLKLPGKEKVGKFAVKAPRISDGTSIDDVIYYFYKMGVKALPYVINGRIKGVFTRSTLLKVLLSMNILKDMKVDEVMNTPVLAISDRANLAQAESAMRENKVNRLVVIDNKNMLEGIITHYDIMKNFMKVSERLPEMKTEVYSPANISIDSVIERSPKTVNLGGSVSDVIRRFVEENFSSAIVVNKGMPIGMVTISDVLEHIIATRRIEAKRIFISGMDPSMYESEDEIREELNSFISKVEKMRGIKVDYITLRIKGKKGKQYELQARISLGKKGIISTNITGYIFEKVLNELLYRLEDNIRKIKDKGLTLRKINLLRETS